MQEPKQITRQEQAQMTKQRIFDCAYQLLQKKEFEDISIKEIVEAAGVSIGTFYLYFPSKLDVYYQTYTLAEAYFAKTVARRVRRGSTLERLQVYFYEYACYNSDYTNLKLTKLLYNSDNKCFLRVDDKPGMRSVLRGILSAGLKCGELDEELALDEIYDFLMNAVRGLTYHWCISDGSYDIKTAMRDYVRLLYRSIEKRRSPST